MTIESYNDITDTQYDALQEIGSIGAGNASTALSNMLNKKVTMSRPKVMMVDLAKLSDLIGGPEEPIVGILITLDGSIKGMMMFAMTQASGRRLANLVIGQDTENMRFNDIDKSALKEIGNIITGAYMNSISMMTGFNIISSVPHLAFDMAASILSVPAIEFGKMGDKALLIDSSFDEAADDIDGYFIMIPDLESYDKIISKLGL
ncbi:MAG: chemotaxis protein CheC [Lachnospiraceae bacterium]|nr:chemotaxis protein CheC [Lachnospiraceae bacterium]